MPDLPEKEILNKLFSEGDKIPVKVKETEPVVDKEVQPLIHKIEEEIYLAKPVIDDYGQPIVSSPAPVQPKITLPVSKTSYTFGLTQKVNESIRWLAEWCLRLIKIFGDKLVFREENPRA